MVTNGSADAQVDTPTKKRPVLRSRIVRVPVGQTGIGRPHDRLELSELPEEARSAVVDLFRFSALFCDPRRVSQPIVCQTRGHPRVLCVDVSMNHSELAMVGFLLHVTSCCSKPQSGSLTLCEKR